MFGEWMGRRFTAGKDAKVEVVTEMTTRRQGYHTIREDWDIVGGNFLQQVVEDAEKRAEAEKREVEALANIADSMQARGSAISTQ